MLLESPNADSVDTTIPGTEDFPVDVVPDDAKIGTDPTSIGFSITVLDDPSVERYGKQNRSTEGCTKLKRSVDMTSKIEVPRDVRN